MTEAAPIRVGLIGCGGNGRGHLQRMSEIKAVEVVGLAEAAPRPALWRGRLSSSLTCLDLAITAVFCSRFSLTRS